MATQTAPPRPRERIRPQGVLRARKSLEQRNAEADRYETAQIRELKAFQSQQIVDPFSLRYETLSVAGDFQIIQPPVNPSMLLRMPRENNILGQCIEAMCTNVEGHGFRFEYIGPEGEEKSAAAKDERQMLTDLVETPNPFQSLTDLRARWRKDMETFGYVYYEACRDRTGRVTLISHVPGHTMRLTKHELEPTDLVVELPRPGTAKKQVIKKRFRRFVQQVGTTLVYFKEFGDPRTIDPKTGLVNENLPFEQGATEIIFNRIYTPGTPYGLPRWAAQLPSIMGSRQAELTNLDFFKENAIPAMTLLVSGGVIPQGTLDEIEDHFLSARGRESFNRILVIEAEGNEDAASRDGNVSAPNMEMKVMANERDKDGRFLEYDKFNIEKIRSSFRLPPVFVGLANDYTHATAKTSFEVAESQVFGPERRLSDEVWNDNILATYSPRFWKFRSNPPRIADPGDVGEALKTFDEIGAMTPNIAIGMINEMFDLDIKTVSEEWGDLPFALTKQIIARSSTNAEDLELPDGAGAPGGAAPASNGPGNPAQKWIELGGKKVLDRTR